MDAKPAIGTASKSNQPAEVEEVGEVRCETVCLGADTVRKAVEGLKR